MEFSNIYRELRQNCYLCLTNLSLKYSIKIKIQLTVSNLSFFIIIHNTFLFVD